MNLTENRNSRRNFLRTSGLMGAGILLPHIGSANNARPMSGVHEFGKREGYTDEISILVSMMDWMRMTVLRSVKDMSVKELDFLIDEDANSIGAMLLHLAATERYYQIHTFENRNWSDFDKKDTDIWDVPMSLGARARKEIKGNPLSYYTDKLAEVRENSLNTLKGKDDSWLMEATNFFANQPTNNYCKWFHVVEHESNHNGQIKFIKSRIS